MTPNIVITDIWICLSRGDFSSFYCDLSYFYKLMLRDWLELKAFRSYASVVKKGGKIPEIMLAWNAKQEELKKQGL